MRVLLKGFTSHTRFSPVHHHFKYPLLMMSVDATKALPKTGLYQLNECDFLQPGNGSISQKVSQLLSQQGYSFNPSSIQLMAIPSFIKKFFRPVSFYLLTNQDNQHMMIAEVTNTYGETHIYISKGDSTQKYSVDKDFHVSPFFDETGSYDFQFTNTAQQFSVQINYLISTKKVFEATFFAHKTAYSRAESIKAAIAFPLNAALTFPRILWQASLLYYQKKLTARSKPMSHSTLTIKGMKLSGFSKWIFKKLDTTFQGLPFGHLTITLPDKSVYHYGNKSSNNHAELICHHPKFFTEIAKSPEIGFGESYVNGYWDTPDLANLLLLMAENGPHIERQLKPNMIAESFNRLLHKFRENTLTKARQNIEAHYDLSNEFYDLFLDTQHKQYSSAIFPTESASLEVAQDNKVQTLINKADIKSNHHILEIGTGWGGLAIALARQTGCQVTTITLSTAQKIEAEKRIADAGLSDQITVLLADFRKLTGKFDRIISIEMIEAVGHKFLPIYFLQLNKLLAPSGKIVLQAITYPCQHYQQYRKGTDFIKKHIFPGGHLPSLTEILNQTQNYTQLRIEHVENIGLHYARTLKEWRLRFEEKLASVTEMGFDERFIRKWRYYLAYCEAGFMTQKLTTHQIVLSKQNWGSD